MVQAKVCELRTLFFPRSLRISWSHRFVPIKTDLCVHLVSLSQELLCVFHMPGFEGLVSACGFDSSGDARMLLTFIMQCSWQPCKNKVSWRGRGAGRGQQDGTCVMFGF